MNILIVTQYFWPETFVINGFAEELQKKGHAVSVLTGLPNYPAGKFFEGYRFWSGPWVQDLNGVHVMRVPLLQRKTGFFRLALNYLSFVIFASVFFLLHKKKKYDLIFCFAPSPATSCLPAVFIRWLQKIPLVFWVLDLWPESLSAVGAVRSSFILNSVGAVVRFIYKRCDMILIQSEAFRSSVMQWGGREEQIHYLPNWADPFESLQQEPKWVADLPKDSFIIAFAGNIGIAQDMNTIVQAALLLQSEPQVKWIIAGDGSEMDWLQKEINQKNLNQVIQLVGRKPYREMLPFFKKADVLLVTLRDEPIFSMTVPAKVQAYLSSGKPIIASIAGEGARIVELAQAGLSCPPQSPEKLSQTVLKMKNLSPEVRQTMGYNGKKFFDENFERKLIVNKALSFFEKAVQDY